MVIGDAPYNVKIANNVSGNGRIVQGEFPMASGEMSKELTLGIYEQIGWITIGIAVVVLVAARWVKRGRKPLWAGAVGGSPIARW